MEIENKQRWENCLRIIRDNLDKEQYEAWFAPITAVDYADGLLTLQVPSAFYAEHIESNYLQLISAALRREFAGVKRLRYVHNIIEGDADTSVADDSSRSCAAPVRQQIPNPFDHQEYAPLDSQLKSTYTFDNYCESSSNKLAYTIASAIANNPKEQTFNPMFIFGPTGVGKTHLIQAVGNRMKEQYPQSRVLYLSARTFESQYTTAVRKNNVNDFIGFYKTIDMLIIDDVQEFAGKTGTQNTFFHIFNYLHNNQKHLILSCDCPPAELDGMEPRLLSRFKWGMTVELSRPDIELRRNVFRQKAREASVNVPEEIINFVAENVKDNVREVEGVFVSLLAYATALNQPFTVELARNVLSNSIRMSKKQISFENIVDAVCSQMSVDTSLLFSKSRKRDVADSRQLIMALAKKHTKMSSTNIGAKLNRDHATVLYACKTIDERISVDKEFRTVVERIEEALRN
ncbi:MAG: chromosomal replication initiator protein DnaA [Bacteroidales bacterium]|nr:chromosomal replication initiator protein DnaA [Bacteroidales bacterium]MDD6140350.1 chromosomal replication initiator protein DnaA [Bacteroidales bacterium]MDD6621788.1 chromosomal replication initiator protein DnaA [Bacteroidales bacterium]MDD6670015.1 chromosomal replication initiator protein DnaA [Bacteroidales bacterium]